MYTWQSKKEHMGGAYGALGQGQDVWPPSSPAYSMMTLTLPSANTSAGRASSPAGMAYSRTPEGSEPWCSCLNTCVVVFLPHWP